MRSLERTVGFRQPGEFTFGDRPEQRDGIVDVLGRDRPPA